MSLAGVRSNGGDIYQLCVAMEWTIQMINEANLAWIEVDSTRLIAGKVPAPVDDVIVGQVDGNEICCQCKIDAPGKKEWTVAGLEDDMLKAANHLCLAPNASVRFYSAAAFGDVARLVERARQVPDSAAFMHDFPANLQKALAELEKAWESVLESGTHSSWELLKRISTHGAEAVADLKEKNKRLLAQYVTRSEEAFDALWATLHNLAGRTIKAGDLADSHRISRDEVLELLRSKGCVVASPKALVDVEKRFARMSQIGREWRRSIADKTIPRKSVAALLDAARVSKRVLLTDGPGAGKTCILLDLVDELERQDDVATLFLQAREFAEAPDPKGREALGFDPNIEALVSTMSERKRVVVVIDSLDVLAVNNEINGLTFFIHLITTLTLIPNVCVIAGCRSFDVNYNHKLYVLKWDLRVEAGLLDWDAEVAPLLQLHGAQIERIDDGTKDLLSNPRNLALFVDLVKKSSFRNVGSSQELIEAYLEAVVSNDSKLGSSAMIAIETMASEMLTARRHQLPRSQVDVDDDMLWRLLSANVLYRGAQSNIGFGHQTLLDALAIRGAVRNRSGLLEFIQTLRPVPFVRPAIRAFFEYLRAGDRREFRVQVRAVFESDVAFHIKRLIAESYAKCEPEPDDWNLIRTLYSNHRPHFNSIYEVADSINWHHFWNDHLVPMLWQMRDAFGLEIHFNRLRLWVNKDPKGVFEFWTEFACSALANRARLRGQFSLVARDFKQFEAVDAQPLLQVLVGAPAQGHDFLGNVLVRWAAVDPRGDELVWRYVSGDVPHSPETARAIDEKLHCDETCFHGGKLLDERLLISDELLDLAVSGLEIWGGSVGRHERARLGKEGLGPNSAFLDQTSFEDTHSQHAHRFISNLARLVHAVESSILHRAGGRSDWWTRNARRICLNDCGGLRQIGVLAMTTFPEANIDCARAFFSRSELLDLTDDQKLGQLITATAPYLGEQVDLIEQFIQLRFSRYYPDYADYADALRYELFRKIPSMLRSAAVSTMMLKMEAELGPPVDQPPNLRASSFVTCPFGEEQVSSLSDKKLLQLMKHSETLSAGPAALLELAGGAGSIAWIFQCVASAEPKRFLRFLAGHWNEIPPRTKVSLFEGTTSYLRYRHTNAITTHWKPIEDIDENELSSLILDELERHGTFWTGTNSGAAALAICARVSRNSLEASRIAFLACSHITAQDPLCNGYHCEDLEGVANTSSRGILADGLVNMARHLLDDELDLPELLPPTLLRLAGDCHPAVRAALIGQLAAIQTKSDLGWAAFEAAFAGADERVWAFAEGTLYHARGEHFVKAQPYLKHMEVSSVAEVRKAWGRLSALAVLRGQMDRNVLFEKLIDGDNADAWEGAVIVWVVNAPSHEFTDSCLEGLLHAATQPMAKQALLSNVGRLCHPTQPMVRLPVELFRGLMQLDGDSDGAQVIGSTSPWLGEWLCELVEIVPDDALEVAEIAAEAAVKRQVLPFYDQHLLGTLMTSLFREAEERERSDQGVMLGRVVALQDAFLSLPNPNLDDWLRDAERPTH